MTADTATPIIPEDFPEALAPLLQAGLDQLHAERREEERRQAAERAAAAQARSDHWSALTTVATANLGSALSAAVDWSTPADWQGSERGHTFRVCLPGCVPIDAWFGCEEGYWRRVAWPTGRGLWRLATTYGETRLVYVEDLGRALALARLYQLQLEEREREQQEQQETFEDEVF